MLLLSETDVRQLLSMDDLIDSMESALAEFSAGRTQQPLRTVLEVGADARVLRRDAGLHAGSGALGTKLVTVFGSNAALGLPSHLATILLMDSTTGELLSVMDGRYITEARTAAVSAVSARLLAREDAGVAGDSRAPACRRAATCEPSATCARCEDVRVWSPSEAHRRAFADEMHREIAAPIAACPIGAGGGRWRRPRRPRHGCAGAGAEAANGSPTARTSPRSAPAGRINARWTRRS